MYPKNAASPEPIAIGAVIQISDGAVQTSGCTVRIKPIGVAEGDGGGTTAYSTDGIVLYTPTQAETNYTSFILIAKKTGCIPVALTVVTTESSVAGRVSLGMINGDAQSASDLKDFADAGYDPSTNKVQGVVLVDTTTTNTDMRGTDNAALAATALSTATWTGTLATNIGTTNTTVATNLDATVSSRLAAVSYTAPANSDIAAILVDTNELQADWVNGGRLDLILDARATQTSVDAIQSDTNDLQTRLPAALEGGRMAAVLDSAGRLAIWNTLTTQSFTADSFGELIIISDGTNGREVKVTAAGHIAADVHDVQPDGLSGSTEILAILADTNELQADWVNGGRLDLILDARASQTSVDDLPTNAELTSVLGTGTWATAVPWNAAWDAEVQSEVQDAIEVNHLDHLLAVDYDPASKPGSATALLNELIGSDAGVSQFTANALELAPSGTGGDATLAKQTEILAAIQGSEVIQVASPNVLGNLVLTQGDSYDGIANPKATWTVTTDYTSGWTVVLTIRDKDDAVIYTTSGTVVNSTTITVTIAAPTGLDMTGCPGQWQGKFDVQLTKAGSIKTIALGTCYINEDQTR